MNEDAKNADSFDSATDAPIGFFETKGKTLTDKFIELYKFLEYREVPKEFLQTIKNNGNVGVKKELEAAFL